MRMTVAGSQTSATLSGLSPAASYHVRILAENRLGLSEPSEPIQVTTQEEGKKPCRVFGLRNRVFRNYV